MLISGARSYKIHIRAIVDDNMIVYKWFGRHQQWWHYEIECAEILEIKIEKYSKYNKANLTAIAKQTKGA